MADVFYPPEIKSNEISSIDSFGSDSASSGSETYRPVSSQERQFPPRIVSHETVSQTLDTKQKKIRGEYSFSKEGAIQIGEYVDGVSGEIAISPDGLVAKNVNGETTVTIDGTTGDATFKGEVKAGSVVTEGDVTVSGLGAFVVNDGTYNVLRLGYFEGGL